MSSHQFLPKIDCNLFEPFRQVATPLPTLLSNCPHSSWPLIIPSGQGRSQKSLTGEGTFPWKFMTCFLPLLSAFSWIIVTQLNYSTIQLDYSYTIKLFNNTIMLLFNKTTILLLHHITSTLISEIPSDRGGGTFIHTAPPPPSLSLRPC